MKIAAYCRVSTDKDEQLDSLENQKQFFSEYAEKNGHSLFHLYADEGISGTSLKKRTQFLRLMKDAHLGLFEAVVVKDISRFARNTVDFLQSIRELKALGINTMFITANMESLGESEFVLTIFGAMAQEESANLSKRVKFGKKMNAKKGRVPQRIFGYDRIDNFTLAINSKEAKVVREIYSLYLDSGLGCRTISLELNRLGYKTKFDCDWNPRAVRRVLTNSIYCGRYVNNKYEIENYLTGKQVHIPEEKHFHHSRPEWAIISEEVFDRAQKQLDMRRTQYDSGEPFRGARYSNKHIFSTLIKCEHCGRSFCQKHYTYVNTRIYWKCSTNDHFTAEQCDNTVKLEENELLSEIQKYFSSLIKDKETFISEILSEIERHKTEECSELSKEEIEKRRKKLLSKKERYQEMYADDIMTMTELKEKTAIIVDELKRLDYDLLRFEQSLAVQQDACDFVDAYTQEIERFLRLETVTNQDLRRVIEHIRVNKDGNVHVVLKKLTGDDLY